MLIVEDPDAPLPTPIAHGVYYAIPADTLSVDARSFDRAVDKDVMTWKAASSSVKTAWETFTEGRDLYLVMDRIVTSIKLLH